MQLEEDGCSLFTDPFSTCHCPSGTAASSGCPMGQRRKGAAASSKSVAALKKKGLKAQAVKAAEAAAAAETQVQAAGQAEAAAAGEEAMRRAPEHDWLTMFK